MPLEISITSHLETIHCVSINGQSFKLKTAQNMISDMVRYKSLCGILADEGDEERQKLVECLKDAGILNVGQGQDHGCSYCVYTKGDSWKAFSDTVSQALAGVCS